MKSSRRNFLITGIGAASSLALSRTALAAKEKVKETDPTAKALGYKHDATQVDAAKQPTYVAGEICGECQHYQGGAGSEWGPCAIFGGKLVAEKGWCSAYVKKA